MKKNHHMIITAAAMAAVGIAASAVAKEQEPPSNLQSFLDDEAAWVQLFDGKTLDGWIGDTKGYVVKDGAITCTPKGQKLYTNKEYSDFVLDLEFKLAPGTNNGIGIRTPTKGDSAYVGMELQVIDNKAEKWKNIKDWQKHGAIYGVVAPKTGFLKPAGEWNRQQVIAVGGHIRIVLNGHTIVDAYDIGNAKPIHDNKHPGLKNKSGHIAFLGHGDFVAYRNIRRIDFASAPPLPESEGDNAPPKGFSALFNGKSLEGWKGLVANPVKRAKMSEDQLAGEQKKADEKMRTHWKSENGELVFDGKGQNLCTDKKYGDFEFYVDWKIPSNADSGIYLRGSPQVQIWDPANKGQWKHGSDKGSGGLWNNKPGNGKDPLVKADNPIGEWNTFFMRMIGENVSIWLNGKLIIDNAVLENYWDRDNPIFREEQIELQNHGQQLWFKNIYLRELAY